MFYKEIDENGNIVLFQTEDQTDINGKSFTIGKSLGIVSEIQIREEIEIKQNELSELNNKLSALFE